MPVYEWMCQCNFQVWRAVSGFRACVSDARWLAAQVGSEDDRRMLFEEYVAKLQTKREKDERKRRKGEDSASEEDERSKKDKKRHKKKHRSDLDSDRRSHKHSKRCAGPIVRRTAGTMENIDHCEVKSPIDLTKTMSSCSFEAVDQNDKH